MRNAPLKTLILSAILIIASSSYSFGKIVDKIVAVINDEVITQSEVDRILYPIYLQYKEVYKSDEDLYRTLDETRLNILKQLVNDKLILSEAKKLGVGVSEAEIDEHVESIKEDLKKKGMDFDRLMKEQNLAIGDIRARYVDQIKIQKTIDLEIRSKIKVQPSETSDYYRDNIEDYSQPEQVAVLAILIKLETVRTPIESRKLAGDIHNMLLDGEDFKRVAMNYSEGPNRESGGNLGYVERGQLLREIDNVIFFLKPGNISDVIETPIGYHILKVYDRKDEKVLPFEEVRPKVTETLYRQKAQAMLSEWLEKLSSNAYISIK